MCAALYLISQYLCALDWSCLYVYEMNKYFKYWTTLLFLFKFLVAVFNYGNQDLVDIFIIFVICIILMVSHTSCSPQVVEILTRIDGILFLNNFLEWFYDQCCTVLSMVHSQICRRIFSLLFLFNCKMWTLSGCPLIASYNCLLLFR